MHQYIKTVSTLLYLFCFYTENTLDTFLKRSPYCFVCNQGCASVKNSQIVQKMKEVGKTGDLGILDFKFLSELLWIVIIHTILLSHHWN